MVGAAGFELATLCSQSRCATRLRYAPTMDKLYAQKIGFVEIFYFLIALLADYTSAATENTKNEKGPDLAIWPFNLMVGAAGFELATLCSQSRCATRLRYAPTRHRLYTDFRSHFENFKKSAHSMLSAMSWELGHDWADDGM